MSFSDFERDDYLFDDDEPTRRRRKVYHRNPVHPTPRIQNQANKEPLGCGVVGILIILLFVVLTLFS